MVFNGLGVAILTPFTEDGQSIDKKSLKRLIDFQIGGGVQAIIAAGTTGESPTLSHKEHREVIEMCLEYVGGRVPVIAGTGSNNTQEAIELTEFAEQAGVSGVLVVNPYYNKPPQEGLYRHFMTIADSADIPNIIYDILPRTSVKVEPDTRVRILSQAENVIGFKEASGVEHYKSCRRVIDDAITEGRIKQKIKYFSGDDDLTGTFIEEGGHGAISVIGNIDPTGTREFIDALLENDFDKANSLYSEGYAEKVDAIMGLATNPIPVKAAAHAMRLIDHPTLRLPLVELSEVDTGKQKQLEQTLKSYRLMN